MRQLGEQVVCRGVSVVSEEALVSASLPLLSPRSIALRS